MSATMIEQPTPSPLVPPIPEQVIDRRRFISAGSALALGLIAAGRHLQAEEFVPAPSAIQEHVEPVACAVIGLGEQGRALLGALANVAGADVRYVCDHYEASHKRALDLFP